MVAIPKEFYRPSFKDHGPRPVRSDEHYYYFEMPELPEEEPAQLESLKSTKSTKSAKRSLFDIVSLPGPHHDYHGDITRESVKGSQLRWASQDLAKSVRMVDWRETQIPSLRPNNNYRPSHHFDRPPGQSHREAFSEGAQYLHTQNEEFFRNLEQGKYKKCSQILGHILHARQDFFAHSNFIDLDERQRELVSSSLMSFQFEGPEDTTIPASLQLTGYSANADDPGMPPNDPWPHDRFAKDNAKFNTEARTRRDGSKSKFWRAYEAAVVDGKAVVARLKADCEQRFGQSECEEKWRRFGLGRGPGW